MNANQHAVLFALFTLAKNDRHATVLRLVQETNIQRSDVEKALTDLERSGLADLERVRLTFAGLAIAASIRVPKARATRATKAA